VRLAVIVVVAALCLGVADLGWHMRPEQHAIAAEPVVQPVAEAAPPALLRMGPVSTGVIAVNDALRGFLNGDADAAFSEIVVRRVPCGTVPSEGRPILACTAGENPGALHQLILSGCKPAWVTPQAAKDELGALLVDTPGLYAVGQDSVGYSAVLSWLDAPERSLILTISSAGVTSYRAGCGLPESATVGRPLTFATTPGD
jgi:hypothetical protein